MFFWLSPVKIFPFDIVSLPFLSLPHVRFICLPFTIILTTISNRLINLWIKILSLLWKRVKILWLYESRLMKWERIIIIRWSYMKLTQRHVDGSKTAFHKLRGCCCGRVSCHVLLKSILLVVFSISFTFFEYLFSSSKKIGHICFLNREDTKSMLLLLHTEREKNTIKD